MLVARSLLLAALSLSSLEAASVALPFFDDFSGLSYSPQTSGSLTHGGFTMTFAGDEGASYTDLHNGSSNAIILGDNIPAARVSTLTLSFSEPISRLILELDAMHQFQNDSITASTGIWDAPASTLAVSSRTIYSTAPIINPGGSGIDDDLQVALLFSAPVSSVVLTSTGAFLLDSIAVDSGPIAIPHSPEPSTLLLATLAGIGLTLKRHRKRQTVA